MIDYGIGNTYSVVMATARFGEEVLLTNRLEELRAADRIILPGVGGFSQGMDNLKRLGLDRLLRETVAAGKPLLGICLGLQMLFEWSEEGESAGLGILKGQVVRFRQPGLLVPHMGWNQVTFQPQAGCYRQAVAQNAFFYFAHSYYVVPEEKEIVAGLTEYGCPFASFIRWRNVAGVQFHPEKSGSHGLAFLGTFLQQGKEG